MTASVYEYLICNRLLYIKTYNLLLAQNDFTHREEEGRPSSHNFSTKHQFMYKEKNTKIRRKIFSKKKTSSNIVKIKIPHIHIHDGLCILTHNLFFLHLCV